MEYVTLEELYEAYYDCRKNKRRKASALAFEFNYERRLRQLHKLLNNKTYEIGKSTVFAVTRPKLREVFAASFKDRIVHHLLMLKLNPILEERMIDNSFNCRKGKGTLFGVKTLQQQIKKVSNNYTKLTFVLLCDLEGFFMSINKDILWNKIETTMKESWKYKYLDWYLWLTKKIIYHRPERHCNIKGSEELLNQLPDNKTLFKSNGNGLPIGNLTSQIFGNYYLTSFDNWIINLVGSDCEYGRYVDDFYIIGNNKKLLLKIIPKIRIYLNSKLKLKLHSRKVSVTDIKKGISFTGTIIKPWGTYIRNRTVNNSFNVSRLTDIKDLKNHVQRLNSYFGFLIHNLTYAIRWNLIKSIPKSIRKDLVCVNMKKLKIKK